MKRALIKEKIEEHNARLSGSISKKTDFLILGENPGSKYEKAKELNIKIINAKEFLATPVSEKIGETNPLRQFIVSETDKFIFNFSITGDLRTPVILKTENVCP